MVSVDRNTLISQIVASNPSISKDYLKNLTDAQLKSSYNQLLFSYNPFNTDLVDVNQEHDKKEKPINIRPNLGMSDNQAETTTIEVIHQNVSEAEEIYRKANFGNASKLYDSIKSEDNKLSSTNVRKVLNYQNQGMQFLIDSQYGDLSRKEYYIQSRQHLKKMILTRLFVLKTPTGESMFDSKRGKYSKDKFAQMIDEYLDEIFANKDLKELKEFQKKVLSENNFETKFLDNVTDYATKPKTKAKTGTANGTEFEYKGINDNDNDKGIPINWRVDEAIPFEEVYLYERGTEYSKDNVERFTIAQANMNFVSSAYNKFQQFNQFATKASDNTLSSKQKEQMILEGFSNYYYLSENNGKNEINQLLEKTKLPMYIDETGFVFPANMIEEDKQKLLNLFLMHSKQNEQQKLDKILKDKSIDEYAQEYQTSANALLGEDDAVMMANAMKEDNLEGFKKYTSASQMAGMGLTIVGGVLTITPLSPLGGAMITIGNTLALSGMSADIINDYTNEFTKENADAESLENTNKQTLTTIGGFVIGAKAGKLADKVFQKALGEKLISIFGKDYTNGNSVQALKNLVSNPENFTRLAKAVGGKVGTDFGISYMGDLAMMGVLNTNDDWESLLKSNLMGVLVSTGSDLKGLSKTRSKVKVDTPTKSNPEVKPDGSTVEVKADGSTVEVKNNGEGKANDVKTAKAEADVKSEAFKSEDELKKYLAEKYGLYSERKKTELIELIELYKEYKDAVSALVKEEKFIDGIGNIPKFSIDTIKKLTPLYKEYKAVSSFSEKLNNYDANIVELALLYKEYQKEVAVLMKEEKRLPDGKEVPKFGYSDIRELAPLYNKYPKEVSTLINEKVVDPNGNEHPRFDSEEIHKLAPLYNKYPEEVSALLKEKCRGFFSEKEGLRFNSNDIIELSPVMNKYPEEVSTLINEKYVDSNGKKLPTYNRENIIQYAPAIKGYSALLKETKLNSKGEKIPKYNIKEICQLASIKDFNLKAAKEQIIKQLEIVKAHPKDYINGEYPNEQKMLQAVDQFFNKYDKELLKASAIFDKEALNHLLRMRFDDASEYLDLLNDFDLPDLNLLKQLSNSTNIDSKPFMPTQKVEFIDLLNAYKENNLETTKIEQMAQEGKIDLAQLNIDLFNKIMKNSGLADDEIASIPKEKLIAWDIKYAHLLSKEIAEEEDPAFSDLLRAGNLEPDFNKYIHDTNNPYGQANAKTKAMYQENNMNYEAWIKPSKENEVHFVSKDKNTEQLNQIASQIAEDINTLMKTPVKGFLKKQYAAKFFKGDEFVIPQEYLTSKSKLTELVKQLSDTSEQGQLTQVWKRAKGNSTNPDPNRAQTARKTLTILDHLNQRLDDLSKVQNGKATKTLDLTIKMWDRNPQKDIFQGNYSTCCIGMGGGNGSAMPYFVMDTAYNMIELVDNTTGKIIGNALCYMVKGENGKPSFIVDNIEINNSEKPSDEVGKQIRSSITEYASKIAKDVTGSDEVPIYLGGQYNDVLISDLPTSTEKVQFIGDVNRERIYMDLYTGWIDKDEFTKPYQVEQWKLK